MVKNKRARQSNLELLRIVAMFMIICCHFVIYNNFVGLQMCFQKRLWAYLYFEWVANWEWFCLL